MICICLLNALFLCFTIPCNAATGFAGFAIFRDGAFWGTTWHAGMMGEDHPVNANPVVHAWQSNSTVIIDSWDNFLDNNTFQGFYYPSNVIPSSNDRDTMLLVASFLTLESILYTPIRQIDYIDTSEEYVQFDEITMMRCDGVVEYCFEALNYRICGSYDYWNITKRGAQNKAEHSYATVTPKKQAQNHMVKWIPDNNVVYVVNKRTGKALDVRGPSSLDGSLIQQWSYQGLSNQKFFVAHTTSSGNDFYSFRPQNATSSAVEVQNNSSVYGTPLQIWTIPTGGYLNSQRFRFEQNSDGSYKILTCGSNYLKAIEVPPTSTNNGEVIRINTDNGTDWQRWFFVPV